MKFFNKLFKREYSHFFIYKWGIFAGILELLIIVLATFSIISFYSIMGGITKGNFLSLLFLYSYAFVFICIALIIVFATPLYLAVKKKRFTEAFLILSITMTTIFVFLSILLLFVSI